MKKVLILGSEGYIGKALINELNKIPEKYVTFGIDNNMKEDNVKMVGSNSLTTKEINFTFNVDISTKNGFEQLLDILKKFKPDSIVHLAEQPSAPFSMIDAEHAAETQRNNIIGTMNLLWAVKEMCPEAHIIKLGTEGEYPDWLWDGKHIPEGSRINVFNKDGDDWTIPTPRYAGSWYHWSKVHDSMNIDYACRIWGLRVTDVNQGIVYSHRNNTRLDVDMYFGTVVHRFVAQAVAGIPLTVHGTGGQTRGFICLQNSLEAIKLLINNRAAPGELRVIHQTTEAKSIKEVAELVQKETGCEIQYIENPRAEMESNKFTFDTSTLNELGLKPIKMEDEIKHLIDVVKENKEYIKPEMIDGKNMTKWS